MSKNKIFNFITKIKVIYNLKLKWDYNFKSDVKSYNECVMSYKYILTYGKSCRN